MPTVNSWHTVLHFLSYLVEGLPGSALEERWCSEPPGAGVGSPVNAADDADQVPALLGQIEGEIASVTADGAYNGEPVYQAVARHQSDPVPDIIIPIPPRASAVLSRQSAEAQSQRDHHVRIIAEKGRMAWQKATGYGRRSLAETAIGRYKAIIGPKLRARILPAQQGETAIAAEVLNHMIRVAKPVSIRAT